MTQDYDVEYTVTASDLKLYTEHFLEIAEILRRHGYQSSPLEITFSRDELQIMAEGLQDLCYQGDDPVHPTKEEHEEILKELQALDPKVRFESKWHFCTPIEWDYEYGDDADE